MHCFIRSLLVVHICVWIGRRNGREYYSSNNRARVITLEDINVKKIFLLERDNREHDYEEVKDRKIVEVYRELSDGESKSILIDNNGSIDEAVTKIYNIIVGV